MPYFSYKTIRPYRSLFLRLRVFINVRNFAGVVLEYYKFLYLSFINKIFFFKFKIDTLGITA